MSLLNFLYLTKSGALEHGMTHEGSMFGVPAWLAVTGDNEITGCPKIPVLQLWCLLVDSAMEVALQFLPTTTVVETPISVARRIVP